jgi:3-phosphoshikimate 1-carboxyvinyltransferase
MLGALSRGTTLIRNYAPGRDCLSTLECLGQLGVKVESQDTTVTVHGLGLAGLSEPRDVLDAGNSGTTMRLLSGILAGQPFYSVITGDDSLRDRPMKRVVDPLRQMGASIWGRHGDSKAPLSIKGGSLSPLVYRMPVASAQVKSAILLAGLYAPGETRVAEPAPSRDHTERLLEFFGATVIRSHGTVGVKGNPPLQSREVEIPGDISSAAFLLAAAAIVPGSDVVVRGVGLNPTRSGFLDVLRAMGARLEVEPVPAGGPEPSADLRIRYGPLRATVIQGQAIPGVIDEIPALAVVATQAQGVTLIRDAQELRAKESDRLRVMAQELVAMGAQVEELPDGLEISGPTPLHGGTARSCGDHRVAMALAVAALASPDPVNLEDPECIAVSYPSFFKALASIGGHPQ